ncbi:MAG: NAD(P)H-dependent oxidoreductase [Patescibacteria group bacterium]
MPHVLIVTAHPSSKGFTHRIAAAFKEGAEAAGKTVEIVDLYKTDLQMGFLSFEERADMGTPNPVREKHQAKVTAADELVFVHPMWWMAPPAIMKNYLDNVYAGRFAFRYKMGSPIPEGLLKGKRGHVFITSDGPMWIYTLFALPFRIIWNTFVFRFCGVKPTTLKVLDKKLFRTEPEMLKFLDKVKRIAGRKY